MPPSMGGTSFPQLSGQSEMARDASLLVTRAPATTSSNVHKAVNTAKRLSPRDRVERAPAVWGGQFWPQPALAGFRCCPARPATSRLPHSFMKFRGPQAPCDRPRKTMVCPVCPTGLLRLRHNAQIGLHGLEAAVLLAGVVVGN